MEQFDISLKIIRAFLYLYAHRDSHFEIIIFAINDHVQRTSPYHSMCVLFSPILAPGSFLVNHMQHHNRLELPFRTSLNNVQCIRDHVMLMSWAGVWRRNLINTVCGRMFESYQRLSIRHTTLPLWDLQVDVTISGKCIYLYIPLDIIGIQNQTDSCHDRFIL